MHSRTVIICDTADSAGQSWDSFFSEEKSQFLPHFPSEKCLLTWAISFAI